MASIVYDIHHCHVTFLERSEHHQSMLWYRILIFNIDIVAVIKRRISLKFFVYLLSTIMNRISTAIEQNMSNRVGGSKNSKQ